ncbi:hypothetical protein KAJ41_02960 [Candidatus Parcubacteria bacterium]|nr:hypothetical protein [Candidatus Parcubacteria bacterium]
MKDENENKIIIEIDEEIPSIIDKLSRCASKEVVLAIPRGALVLRSIINLKILKKRAEEINKNISILKIDRSDVDQDQSAGKKETRIVSSIVENNNQPLDLNRKINDTSEKRSAYQNNNSQNEDQIHKVKVFDIVRKVKIAENDESNEPEIFRKETNSNKAGEEFSGTLGGSELKAYENRARSDKKRKKTIIVSAINSKLLVLFILMIIVTVSIAAFFMFQKAEVNIVLEKELVSYNFEFTADENIEKIDVNNKKISLDIINIDIEESSTYPTTGKKHIEEKASGEITVFNEYSSTPQRIVASTRFISKTENKLFRVKQAVTIPGFSRVEGVDIPGQITIKVYADKAGEEYNISSTSFHLPGLQGSAKYNSIYARSTKEMTGGMNKEVDYFSESDYLTAKGKLVKLVKERNEQDLSNKISDEVIAFDDLREVGEIEISTDIEIGEVADNFEITVSIRSSVSTILKNDLNMLVDEKVDEKLEKNKMVLHDSRSFELGDVSISAEGKVMIPISVKQYVAVEINIDKMKEEIANKNKKELTTYFNNISGIKSTSISLEPKWVEKIPSSYDKINITIDINNSL